MVADLCSVTGCSKGVKTRGWCPMHYERWRVHGDPMHETWPRRTACSIAGCGKPHRVAGYCSMHYSRLQRNGAAEAAVEFRGVYDTDICSVKGCAKPRAKRGWCAGHYSRWRKHGDVTVCLNPWGERTDCQVCGGQVPPESGRRGYCSAACSQIGTRERNGQPTFLSRTHCVACGTFLPLETVSGFRRRGNGAGRCWSCADKAPCPQCGVPRKRRGSSLTCVPCTRPKRVAEAQLQRAVKRAAICEHGSTCVTSTVIADIRQRACFYCDRPAAHADHFYPLARGGAHCRENLVPACAACNLAKSDNDPWDWWTTTFDRREVTTHG